MFNEHVILENIGEKDILIFSKNEIKLFNQYFTNVHIFKSFEEHNFIKDIKNYNIVITEEFFINSKDDLLKFLLSSEKSIMIFNTLKGYVFKNFFKFFTQNELDTLFIENGFQMKESNCHQNMYNHRRNNNFNEVVIYKKLEDKFIKKYPLEFLLKDRELHMDMLRESSVRSEAHVVRYSLAAQLINQGDSVLDCASGLGYGTSILAKQSKGKDFLGVDLEPSSIDYSNDMYGIDNYLKYKQGDAQNLDFIDDASIDFVVSFETIEHVPDYKLLLSEFNRVLAPGGKMMICAPNLWVDETGKDPNPYHFHEFDFDKLIKSLESKGFYVDRCYSHTAPGGPTNCDYKRELKEVSLEPLNFEAHKTDWLMFLVVKSPFGQTNKEFIDKSYPKLPSEYICGDFSKFYKNPWLYKSLIQLGERVNCIVTHNTLLEKGVSLYEKDKYTDADYGACLTTLGYNLFYEKFIYDEKDYLNNIQNFLSEMSQNLHVYRWQISAAYLGFLLALKLNLNEEKEKFINFIINSTPEKFSCLLLIKKVSILFYLGTLSLGKKEKDKAKKYFIQAMSLVELGISSNHLNSFGTIGNPNLFGFSELAQLSEMGATCSKALNLIDKYELNPGMFFKIIDIKNFGLKDWIQYLEKVLYETNIMFGIHKYEINEILIYLDKYPEIAKINIYGAGAFYLELKPYLKAKGIDIVKIFDKKAQNEDFIFDNQNVESLESLIDSPNNSPIIVASANYAYEIIQDISKFRDANGISNKIISIFGEN